MKSYAFASSCFPAVFWWLLSLVVIWTIRYQVAVVGHSPLPMEPMD
ncbi:MAG TPA: hypothetical protein VFB12_22405 [Ktedonobacteraceae bacterium]|nr:hypothetical protein [Ktedonobacteraceae bacterium]